MWSIGKPHMAELHDPICISAKFCISAVQGQRRVFHDGSVKDICLCMRKRNRQCSHSIVLIVMKN